MVSAAQRVTLAREESAGFASRQGIVEGKLRSRRGDVRDLRIGHVARRFLPYDEPDSESRCFHYRLAASGEAAAVDQVLLQPSANRDHERHPGNGASCADGAAQGGGKAQGQAGYDRDHHVPGRPWRPSSRASRDSSPGRTSFTKGPPRVPRGLMGRWPSVEESFSTFAWDGLYRTGFGATITPWVSEVRR